MMTSSAISPELAVDSMVETSAISRALDNYIAYRTESGVPRMLRSTRHRVEGGAWHRAIQIALPLAGPALGFAALIAVSLVQG